MINRPLCVQVVVVVGDEGSRNGADQTMQRSSVSEGVKRMEVVMVIRTGVERFKVVLRCVLARALICDAAYKRDLPYKLHLI